MTVTDADLIVIRRCLDLAEGSDAKAIGARKTLWKKYAPILFDEVVALRKMLALKGIPGRSKLVTISTRERIILRDKHLCRYCGRRVTKGTRSFDHVLPRSRGGQYSYANVVLACKPCNSRKRDRTPEEAGMALLPAGEDVSRVVAQSVVIEASRLSAPEVAGAGLEPAAVRLKGACSSN